jgi:hypothetical protein
LLVISIKRYVMAITYADSLLDTRNADTRYFVVKSFNHDNVKMAQKDVRSPATRPISCGYSDKLLPLIGIVGDSKEEFRDV